MVTFFFLIVMAAVQFKFPNMNYKIIYKYKLYKFDFSKYFLICLCCCILNYQILGNCTNEFKSLIIE